MRCLLLLLGIPLLFSCVDAPRVIQGKVTRYEHSSQLLALEDELPPGKELELSLAGAEVGAAPAVGDTVRLAYREREGRLVAVRLANISRQSEIGGKKK